ncbi:MAG: ABC transporter substrate-binding protein [Aestuariivirga sp.]
MTGRVGYLKALLLAGVIALPGSATAGRCVAESFVKNAGAAIMRAARTGSAEAFSGAASRHADVNVIALFALGPYRRSLPKSREAEYVRLTRAFIGEFMARYAGRFNGTGIDIISCTGGPRALIVKARLTGGQNVIFKLHKTRAGYRVQDLNVSSIWLAQQLRSTFTGVIRRNDGDIGALLNYLRG